MLIVLSILSTFHPLTSSAQDASTYMYWASWGLGKIQRANLDGTNLQDLVSELTCPRDVAPDIAGNKMYWVDACANKVQRANLDGTNIEDLVNTQGQPFGVAVDTTNGKIYWSTWNPGKIRRANLDGTNVEDFVTGLSEPEDIDLDLSRGKIYWTDTVTNKIQRANLDGTNIEDLVTVGLSHPLGLTLDVVGGKIYWTNSAFHPGPWPGLDKIQRANLDGTHVEDLVTTGLVAASGIDLDLSRGKMYWTDIATNKIQRANLDGSSVEDVIVSSANALINPNSLALGIPQTPSGLRFTPSTIADQTFTINTSVNLTLPSAIGGTAPYTYSLSALPAGLYFDASGRQIYGTPTTVVSATPVTYTATDAIGSTASLDFTITVQDTPPGTNVYMYWADLGTNKIQRANLDGTNLQDLATGFGRPVGIALDMTGGKLYWTDRSNPDHKDPTSRNSIQRMNLDGTNIETLVTGGPSVKEAIALDLLGGKMYWAVWSEVNEENKIQRANLDGSNIEDLVTGLFVRNPATHTGPRGIALDLPAGKMYWTDCGGGKIQRANLNGTNIEDIITGLYCPTYIALDSNGGKLYWPDWDAGKIHRANLDGSNIEDLVIDLADPAGIAIDGLNGKIYWADAGTHKIQRANLNGTNIENLITTGLLNPIGIALGIDQLQPGGGLRFSPNVIADQTFTVGTYASLNLPVAMGGTEPYTYTLTPDPPVGLQFDASDRWIGGTPTTPIPTTTYTYTVTDTTAQTASLTFTITVTGAGANNLDVNADGQLNVLDLILVAVFYGTQGDNIPADVNADGIVNVQDFAAVAEGVDAAGALPLQAVEAALLAAAAQAGDIEAIAGAPVIGFSKRSEVLPGVTVYSNVAAALADAKHLATGDVRLGKWLPLLEELLHLLTEMQEIPDTTALLHNYPNPFNPETWIPYHLATDAEVMLTIYDVRGDVVRALRLGHQQAGVYQSKHRAAYWNGRNQIGEPVASGLYFYTLTAGDFTATRKLLIAK